MKELRELNWRQFASSDFNVVKGLIVKLKGYVFPQQRCSSLSYKLWGQTGGRWVEGLPITQPPPKQCLPSPATPNTQTNLFTSPLLIYLDVCPPSLSRFSFKDKTDIRE